MQAPPLVLFNYARMPYSIAQSMPASWAIGKTDSGWMTSESFYSYITNVFSKWLRENNIELPVILYVDGHKSHITYPTVQFCRENGIELICLYPNATHKLQHLDVGLFKPLKSVWKQHLSDFRGENPAPKRRFQLSSQIGCRYPGHEKYYAKCVQKNWSLSVFSRCFEA